MASGGDTASRSGNLTPREGVNLRPLACRNPTCVRAGNFLVPGALQKWNTMPAENRPSLDVCFVEPVITSN